MGENGGWWIMELRSRDFIMGLFMFIYGMGKAGFYTVFLEILFIVGKSYGYTFENARFITAALFIGMFVYSLGEFYLTNLRFLKGGKWERTGAKQNILAGVQTGAEKALDTGNK